MNQATNQVFNCFVFKGERSPSDQGDLGEDVAPKQILKQHPARFPRGTEDETAFILLPEIFFQSLGVLSHAVCKSRHLS